MAIARILLSLILITTGTVIDAQVAGYEMSRPIDLDLVGVNKVLQMTNGNTLLFHFEPSKGITIKVFDSTRRQVASRKELCRYLDVYVIQNAMFKGLFEINSEAVLFFDQENKLSQHCLIRLRFSAKNGSLIEEKVVAESKNKNTTMRFYVMKQQDSDNYSILFSTIKNHPDICDLYVVFFNKNHEALREVQMNVDRAKYDYISVIGAVSLLGGDLVSLGCSKLLINGTVSHGGEYDPTNNEYNHYVALYYIPRDSGAIATRVVDVSSDVFPFHTYVTFDPFSDAVNVLMLSYKDAVLKYGLELLPAAVMGNLFMKFDRSAAQTETAWIYNTLANKNTIKGKDSSGFFQGLPLAVFTNENGLSTMVSEAFTRYQNVESSEHPHLFETYLGNICITQFDDDGKEIWGTLLQKSQYYKSYRHYYYANQLSARWHEQMLLGDLPDETYARQFVSVNTYADKKNVFIIFNDDSHNFQAGPGQKPDTLFTYAKTNACYYVLSNKKELTRNYLFGEPLKNEYKAAFIEGADYDDKTGVYATLVQYTKGEKTTLRMAWAHL